MPKEQALTTNPARGPANYASCQLRLNAHSWKAERPLSYGFSYYILDRFIAGSSPKSYIRWTEEGAQRSRILLREAPFGQTEMKQARQWTSLPISAI
jgi:hypothetical protein